MLFLLPFFKHVEKRLSRFECGLGNLCRMPASEQGNLIGAGGQPTQAAWTRLANAIFLKGYADSGLIDLFAESSEEEMKNLMNALLSAAPLMAKLDGLGKFDIRSIVTEAANAAITARRNNVPLRAMDADGLCVCSGNGFCECEIDDFEIGQCREFSLRCQPAKWHMFSEDDDSCYDCNESLDGGIISQCCRGTCLRPMED